MKGLLELLRTFDKAVLNEAARDCGGCGLYGDSMDMRRGVRRHGSSAVGQENQQEALASVTDGLGSKSEEARRRDLSWGADAEVARRSQGSRDTRLREWFLRRSSVVENGVGFLPG